MEKIINLIKDSTASMPKLLLLNYKELKITDQELIFLIYILNEKNMSFNPKKISEDLNIKLPEALTLMDSLSGKDIIKLELKKINGIREEFINMEFLYQKLAYLVNNDKPIESENKSSTIFDTFEQEFGRTLSPMEYEIINSWIDASFKEELIIYALKEATYNGVSNLRYIDKILYEWKKKGYQTKSDLENSRNTVSKPIQKPEMFDYNWLDGDE